MNRTAILNLIAAVLSLGLSVMLGLANSLFASGVFAVAAFGFLFATAFWYDKK